MCSRGDDATVFRKRRIEIAELREKTELIYFIYLTYIIERKPSPTQEENEMFFNCFYNKNYNRKLYSTRTDQRSPTVSRVATFY